MSTPALPPLWLLTRQVSVGLMIGGAVVAAFFDLKFELGGYLMILSNDFFTAAYGVSIKRALNLKIPQMRYASPLLLPPPPYTYTRRRPPRMYAKHPASKMFPAKLLRSSTKRQTIDYFSLETWFRASRCAEKRQPQSRFLTCR